MARNVPIYMRATLEEVEAMRQAQKEDNRIRPQQSRVQKLGDWCLGLIREHLEFRRKAEAAEMKRFAAGIERAEAEAMRIGGFHTQRRDGSWTNVEASGKSPAIPYESDGCDDGITDWKEVIREDFGFEGVEKIVPNHKDLTWEQLYAALWKASDGVKTKKARLEGEAGHGAPGDPATRVQASPAFETPSPPLRSWVDIKDPAERLELAAKWTDKRPPPTEFKEWNNMSKIEWLDRNWPLEG